MSNPFKEELWLEYGHIQEHMNNWHDVYWYNEGRAGEIGYWLKGIWRRVTRDYKSKMYYKLRWGKVQFEVRF